MLSLIRVRNYAVIDEVEVQFEPGFSVLTGETGAGKSILVDALSLALGDRADAGAVRSGADRAEISVRFDCPEEHAALGWLEERGLETEERCCVLRRIVGAEGRSRAFVNNQPATLQDLRSLGSLLVNIHGQHAHQSLLDPSVQRAMLDEHGGHEALAEQVTAAFRDWRGLEDELQGRRRAGDDHKAKLELLRFQASELERLALGEGEVERLLAERGRLANIDRLISGVGAALGELYEADVGSAYALIADARQQLARLAELDADLRGAADTLGEAEIQLREVAADLRRYGDHLEIDPERLEWVETRLATIRALARRHDVRPEEVPRLLGTLQEQIRALESGGESLEALAAKAERAESAYFELAAALSAARARSAASLGEKISAQLPSLGLPHGRFEVVLTARPRERAEATGLERVEFRVGLNPGHSAGSLARVASGGELSRISLAVEVVAAGATAVPTLIFDEVDAGIGGGVAEMVGRRLSRIAAGRQVLCVTHLPQVASQGRHHYRVLKRTDGDVTRTDVVTLDEAERVDELSRMLGGVEITERARAHAAEMIDRAAK
jgi:DNA repair protein RecN (Recombination protein N)